jgi:hypothetical protein
MRGLSASGGEAALAAKRCRKALPLVERDLALQHWPWRGAIWHVARDFP